MSPKITPVIASIILLTVLVSGCQSSSQETQVLLEESAILVPDSGTYSRSISTSSPMTQQFFDQGLRFAWGFYFPESIASYQQASTYDPGHPMPYWGLAHAMGPNPNSRYARMPDDPKGEGNKAIKMALARIDRANEVERALINALAILYDKEAVPDDAARDDVYLARMRDLNQQYPNDPDIAALYAAAYMSIRRWDYWDENGRPKDETIPVAEALERIMARDMTNPGVLHLHIHLLEASAEPQRALVSADALEATLPIGGHIVHMPAHIYVRVGQFQRAIDNNVRSQLVDKQFAEIWGDLPLPNLGTYPLSHKMHAGHAIDFIRYAATVQGNYTVAIEAALAAKTRVLTNNQNIRVYQKTLAAPWLVQKIFGQWDQLLEQSPSHQGTPYLDGIWAYTLGSAYNATGNVARAELELRRLRTIADAPDADDYRVGATPASAVLKLASLGLTGEILQTKGDLAGAIRAYKEGILIEDQNNYTEPPDWAQPMRQYLGAALLEAGNSSEAERVYRRDLRWNQNNGWSLLGLYQALKQQGKTEEATQTYAMYQEAWRYSKIELTRSRH